MWNLSYLRGGPCLVVIWLALLVFCTAQTAGPCIPDDNLALPRFLPGGGWTNSSWLAQATAKTARTREKIPRQWILSSDLVAEGRNQQYLLGKNNQNKTIEEFIASLPDQAFNLTTIAGQSRSDFSAETVIKITKADPVDLVNFMRNKTYTAVQVVVSFCIRASVIHQVHPVLLDVGFEQAIEAAKDLDQYFSKTGKLKGALHGLPISMKDKFHAVGMETTGSFVGWFEPTYRKPAPRVDSNPLLVIHPDNFDKNPKNLDSDIIAKLKAQGAIPIAKTSIMQSTWAMDTENNFLGYLTNPYNKHLSSGGSSGGEGVFQALGGSAFGLGSDSGGSGSMPASLNGLVSLKPSSGYKFVTAANGVQQLVLNTTRLSMENTVSFGTRLETTEITCPALLARSFRTLQYVYKAVGPSYTQTPSSKETRFAFLANDGRYTAHPPLQRALNETRAALRRQKGVSLMDYTSTASSTVGNIHPTLAREDGVIDIYYYRQTTGEPFTASLGAPIFPFPAPWNTQNQQDMDQAVQLRDQYRQEYENYLKKNNISAVIMPPFATADWREGAVINSQTFVTWANVLNVPTITIHTTYASKAVDKKPGGFTGMSQSDAALMSLYDADAADGTPISIFMLGSKEKENELLDAAAVVVQALTT